MYRHLNWLYRVYLYGPVRYSLLLLVLLVGCSPILSKPQPKDSNLSIHPLALCDRVSDISGLYYGRYIRAAEDWGDQNPVTLEFYEMANHWSDLVQKCETDAVDQVPDNLFWLVQHFKDSE